MQKIIPLHEMNSDSLVNIRVTMQNRHHIGKEDQISCFHLFVLEFTILYKFEQ